MEKNLYLRTKEIQYPGPHYRYTQLWYGRLKQPQKFVTIFLLQSRVHRHVFRHFIKGYNFREFLLASLEDIVLPKGDPKRRNLPLEEPLNTYIRIDCC